MLCFVETDGVLIFQRNEDRFPDKTGFKEFVEDLVKEFSAIRVSPPPPGERKEGGF